MSTLNFKVSTTCYPASAQAPSEFDSSVNSVGEKNLIDEINEIPVGVGPKVDSVLFSMPHSQRSPEAYMENTQNQIEISHSLRSIPHSLKSSVREPPTLAPTPRRRSRRQSILQELAEPLPEPIDDSDTPISFDHAQKQKLLRGSVKIIQLETKQLSIIKVWTIVLFVMLFVLSINTSLVWSFWKTEVQVFLACRNLVVLALGVQLYLIHWRGRSDLVFQHLLLLTINILASQLFLRLDPDDLVEVWNDRMKGLLQRTVDLRSAAIVVETQVIFMSVEVIKEKRQRQIYFTTIWAFYLVMVLQQALGVIREKKQDGESIIAVSVTTASILSVTSGLQYCFYQVSQLGNDIIQQEQVETSKHLTMFNALTDGIVLVRDKKLAFINKVAKKLFTEKGKCTMPLSVKKFFVYQQIDKESASTASSLSALSITDLLRKRHAPSAIFTTSEDIAQCNSLDQIQKVIEAQQKKQLSRSSYKEPLFVQINFIRVNKERSTDTLDAQGDEVMVQIQDISHRILGQSLEIERQYLTIMNSTVSHEMRNPLNALLSSVEVQEGLVANLESQGGPPEILKEIRKNLGVAQSSGKLLKFNVEDILAMPQLQQGKFTKNITRVCLDRSVREISSILDYQTKSKGINVSSEFVALGNSSESSFNVLIDEQRFQQILLNFLSNAVKFTPRNGHIRAYVYLIRPGDPEPRDAGAQFFKSPDWPSLEDDMEGFVHSQAETVRRMLSPGHCSKVVLSVMDTGVGIKPVDQAKLFKLFGCLQATRKINTKGIGLGLAISKMIAEEFGGEVAVLSEHGRGSAFYASFEYQEDVSGKKNKSELDLKLEAIQQRQLNKARINLEKMTNSGKELADGQRILIVDDEAYNCEMLKAIIQGLGFINGDSRLDLCLSGAEALEKMKERHYPLILTDLSMPEMDGFEFARHIQELYKNKTNKPKVVVVTGHTESEYLEEAFSCGISQLYSKPLSSDSISLLLTECGFSVKLKPQVMQRLGLASQTI